MIGMFSFHRKGGCRMLFPNLVVTTTASPEGESLLRGLEIQVVEIAQHTIWTVLPL